MAWTEQRIPTNGTMLNVVEPACGCNVDAHSHANILCLWRPVLLW
jgi:hypothetical protein